MSTEVELEEIADRLLLKIRSKAGQSISITGLIRSLQIDRDRLETAVRLLASYDYRLRKRKESITFVEAPDRLIDTEVSYRLKTSWLGCQITAYNSVKSTNDIAIKLAEGGSAHGTIIVAEQQTKGRGRLGRSWYSPPGTGIYVSIVLRPRFSPEKAPGISIMSAVALADIVSQYCPGEVGIKWPNDLLIGEKKAAGILTELSADRERINYLVVGVGINVNQGVGAFPEEIRRSATSLRRVLKRKVKRVELLRLFLRQFEKNYDIYSQHGLKKLLPKIRNYSSLIGRDVTVRSGRTLTRGRAIDINGLGCLILDSGGELLEISAGEVTVEKE